MIAAAVIAILFAIGQFMLDVVIFAGVFAARTVKALLSLLLKLVLYGAAFWLLFKVFKAFVTAAAIGFGIGFFPCLIIYALKKIGKSA